MENIREFLQRGFLGGITAAAALAGFVGFLYLVYRFIKFLRPSDIRQEERRICSHRFYKVSGRGRAAYLILCLEEAIKFYALDFSSWEWVLRELWSITTNFEGDWIGVWLDSVGELLPSQVLAGKAEQEAPDAIRKLQNLYAQSGTAMILVNTLMENIYAMVCEWSPGMVAHDPDALRFIEEAEEMMEKLGVPLPVNETVQALVSQKDSSLGKPFDGLSLSSLKSKDK